MVKQHNIEPSCWDGSEVVSQCVPLFENKKTHVEVILKIPPYLELCIWYVSNAVSGFLFLSVFVGILKCSNIGTLKTINFSICPKCRGDQIFFSATCPGQVACKNPLVLRNFLLVPKYFSNRKSIGQVANTTISLPLNQSCRWGEQWRIAF